MTRDRMYGSDVEFCAWLRERRDLPSYSLRCGFVATDVDLLIHRYLTEVDGVGTREVQSLMHLEVKTRGGEVPSSQRDTLFKQHVLSQGIMDIDGNRIQHWGVAIVFLSGTDPDNSERIQWGRFLPTQEIVRFAISMEQLLKLMRFELHPDSLKGLPL